MEKRKRSPDYKLTPDDLQGLISLKNKGMTNKQIAEVTGIGPTVVQRRLWAANNPDTKPGFFSWNDWKRIARYTI